MEGKHRGKRRQTSAVGCTGIIFELNVPVLNFFQMQVLVGFSFLNQVSDFGSKYFQDSGSGIGFLMSQSL